MNEKRIDEDKLRELLEQKKTGREIAAYFGVSPAAVSKKIKRLAPKPEVFEKLTPQEQSFCLSMAEGKSRTAAAMDSYNCTSLDSAKTMGSRLMTKSEINIAISELLAETGLTKRYRLGKLKKHVDSASADISLKALDQSWKLDGSYAAEKNINLNINYADLVQEEKRVQAEFDALMAGMGVSIRDGNIIDATPDHVKD